MKCNIFDEDMVYQLLAAMQQRRQVELDLGTEKVTAVPVALRADVRLGRWYLLSMEEKPVLRRVRFIRRVKLLRPIPEREWQALRDTVCAAFAHSLCSGRVPGQGRPVRVRARLEFQGAPGMRAQFLREMQAGEVTQEGDGEYYQVLVNDPEELVPFLRSFAPWLRVEPGEHDLPRRLEEDFRRMEDALECREG